MKKRFLSFLLALSMLVGLTVGFPAQAMAAESQQEPELVLATVTLPVKTHYKPGEAFDFTGLVFSVEYGDGTLELVTATADMVDASAFDGIPGEKSIVITYEGSSCCFTAYVVAPDANFNISGPVITDPFGKEFIPIGANVHGPFSWSTHPLLPDFELIADRWQFNCLRLVTGFGLLWQTSVNNDMDAIVKAFTDRGIVVMIEIHDYTGSFPFDEEFHNLVGIGVDPERPEGWTDSIRYTLETFTEKWVELASKYKDNPYVWFNIMNEPATSPGSTMGYDPVHFPDWATSKWRSWAPSRQECAEYWYYVHDTVMGAIREAGCNNVIVLDEQYFGQGAYNLMDPDDYGSAILTMGPQLNKKYDNLLYSLHPYGWTIKSMLNKFVLECQSRDLALVIGEFGAQYLGSPLQNLDAVLNVYDVCIPLKVGRIFWDWSEQHETIPWKPELWEMGLNAVSCNAEFGDGIAKRPTNLSWLGDLIWDDAHGTLTAPVPISHRPDWGDNLISNGDFSMGLNGWHWHWDYGHVYDSDEITGETMHIARIESAPWSALYAPDTLLLEPGRQYNISFWFKGPRTQIFIGEGSYTYLMSFVTNNIDINEWQYYSVTFTPTTYMGSRFACYQFSDPWIGFYITQVSLVDVTGVAPPPTPTPKPTSPDPTVKPPTPTPTPIKTDSVFNNGNPMLADCWEAGGTWGNSHRGEITNPAVHLSEGTKFAACYQLLDLKPNTIYEVSVLARSDIAGSPEEPATGNKISFQYASVSEEAAGALPWDKFNIYVTSDEWQWYTGTFTTPSDMTCNFGNMNSISVVNNYIVDGKNVAMWVEQVICKEVGKISSSSGEPLLTVNAANVGTYNGGAYEVTSAVQLNGENTIHFTGAWGQIWREVTLDLIPGATYKASAWCYVPELPNGEPKSWQMGIGYKNAEGTEVWDLVGGEHQVYATTEWQYVENVFVVPESSFIRFYICCRATPDDLYITNVKLEKVATGTTILPGSGANVFNGGNPMLADCWEAGGTWGPDHRGVLTNPAIYFGDTKVAATYKLLDLKPGKIYEVKVLARSASADSPMDGATGNKVCFQYNSASEEAAGAEFWDKFNIYVTSNRWKWYEGTFSTPMDLKGTFGDMSSVTIANQYSPMWVEQIIVMEVGDVPVITPTPTPTPIPTPIPGELILSVNAGNVRTYNGGAYEVTSAVQFNGEDTIHFTGAWGQIWREITLEVEPGATYLATGWAYVPELPNGEPKSWQMGIGYRNAEGTEVWDLVGGEHQVYATTEWQYVENVFVAPESTFIRFYICCRATPDDLYIADINLYKIADAQIVTHNITVGEETHGGAGFSREITISGYKKEELACMYLTVRVINGTGENTNVMVMLINASENATVSYNKENSIVDVWLTDGLPNLTGGQLGVTVYGTGQGK